MKPTDIRKDETRVRQECHVTVPVAVPEGYQVAVQAAILEYAGFVAEGGQGHTTLRYRLDGTSSEGITKVFPEGPLSEDDSRIIYTPEYLRFSSTVARMFLLN